MKEHWSRIPERTTVLGIRLLLLTYILGRRITFFLALWPVIFIYWLFGRGIRESSEAYLVALRKHFGKEVGFLKLSSLCHVFRFADTMLDKFLAVGGILKRKHVRVLGARAMMEEPRGGILVTAHMGCLELCQMLSDIEPGNTHKLYVMVHTEHAQEFNRLLREINPKFDFRHLQVTDNALELSLRVSEIVESGDWVVIAGDRTPIHSDAVLSVDFLGKKALFPIGAYVMGVLLQCPIWSVLCTRNHVGSERYLIEFKKLYEPENIGRGQREQVYRMLLEKFVDELEQRLKESPYDWFNFYCFWQEEQGK